MIMLRDYGIISSVRQVQVWFVVGNNQQWRVKLLDTDVEVDELLRFFLFLLHFSQAVTQLHPKPGA